MYYVLVAKTNEPIMNSRVCAIGGLGRAELRRSSVLRRPGAAGVVVDGHDAARGVVEAEGAIEARPEADLEEDAHPPPRARLAGQGDRSRASLLARLPSVSQEARYSSTRHISLIAPEAPRSAHVYGLAQ